MAYTAELAVRSNDVIFVMLSEHSAIVQTLQPFLHSGMRVCTHLAHFC